MSVVTPETSTRASAESRVRALGIQLPPAPKPFGAYVPAVRSAGFLFVTGMLPAIGHEAQFLGRLGAELDAEAGRQAARLAALNVLAVAKEHLGSLDEVIRVVRLTVFLATAGQPVDQPRVADGASELFREVFGPEGASARSVIGVASLPLGMPVELEVTLEVRT
jgi:enamine deaminase RidA (YjgF/YER057c/UK114 family)